ncbi:hypothetical protein Trydic_g16423 [Trypoxylus dichotomus]
MDDLKIYAKNQQDLQKMLNVTQEYIHNTGMTFNANKCAIYHLECGRSVVEGEIVSLLNGSTIQHLQRNNSYTHLGIKQREVHDIMTVKATLVERYKKTLRTIWMSELRAKHKSKATNMLAVPIVSHTFASIRWNVDEINQLDRDTRKTLTMCRGLYPNASVHRLYLPRREGGRGFINIEWLHNRLAEKDGTQGSFLLKAAVRACQALKIPFHAAPASRKKDNILEKPKQELKTLLKRAVCQHLKEEHLQKPMHAQYFKLVYKQGLSPELSFSYLTSPTLYLETEGYITAVQNGMFHTLAYAKRVLRMPLGDTRCRACRTHEETVMHLLSACPRYAPTLYTDRHNMALKVLYYHLRHEYKIDEQSIAPYQVRTPEAVITNDRCKMYWNFSFSTTRPSSSQ